MLQGHKSIIFCRFLQFTAVKCIMAGIVPCKPFMKLMAFLCELFQSQNAAMTTALSSEPGPSRDPAKDEPVVKEEEADGEEDYLQGEQPVGFLISGSVSGVGSTQLHGVFPSQEQQEWDEDGEASYYQDGEGEPLHHQEFPPSIPPEIDPSVI